MICVYWGLYYPIYSGLEYIIGIYEGNPGIRRSADVDDTSILLIWLWMKLLDIPNTPNNSSFMINLSR